MLRTIWARKAGMSHITAPALFKDSMSYLDGLKEIEGLGDKTYWGGSGLKMGAGLHVLDGDTFMTVVVEVGDAEISQKKAGQLASIIVEKLK